MSEDNLLKRVLPVLLIVLAGVLAYSSSHQGEFFEVDDIESLRDNPHIRRLWPLSEPLCVPLWNTGATVDTRPVLALSFALNYQLTGDGVWGFHLINLLIHLTGGVLLFGIIRRTILRLPPGGRPRTGPTAFAAVAAAVWVVHPLQTEAVTYTVQRAESLMGMFYLLTLYASIRAFEGKSPERGGKRPGWGVTAVVACALGMGTKESMVTAPLLVVLYDYVFSGGEWSSLWRRRKNLYIGLFATWIIMVMLVLGTLEGMYRDSSKTGMLRYAISQPLSILKYLRLVFWPRGLVLDYTNRISQGWKEIALPALPLVLLFVYGVLGTARRRPLGFLSLAFFVLLSPSSSIAPTHNVYCEHRMYLALAAVIIPALLALSRLTERCVPEETKRRVVNAALAGILIFSLAAGTYFRNFDWMTEKAFWTDNVVKRPNSSAAHNNVGNVLLAEGRVLDAIAHYREAMRIAPEAPHAHSNMGNALLGLGDAEAAIARYREAVRLDASHVHAHYNWGNALLKLGRVEEAADRYRAALKIMPASLEANNNLSNALLLLGRHEEASVHSRRAIEAAPNFPEPHFNLGSALLMAGKLEEAESSFEQALKLNPEYEAARSKLVECRRMILLRGSAGDSE